MWGHKKSLLESRKAISYVFEEFFFKLFQKSPNLSIQIE